MVFTISCISLFFEASFLTGYQSIFISLSDATEPTSKPFQAYWWPVEPDDGPRQCVYSTHYPETYLTPLGTATFLFNSESECCQAWNVCPPESTTTTTAIPKEAYYYPNTVDGKRSCVYDAFYPDNYLLEVFKSDFLFVSHADCCDAHPTACLGNFWFPNESGSECTYGSDFPPEWTEETGSLFGTEEDCMSFLTPGDAGGGEL